MNTVATDGQQLISLGWNQGSYFACSNLSQELKASCIAGGPQLYNNLEQQLSNSKNILIVTSQTCDIAANTSLEPAIECILAKKATANNYLPHPANLNGHSTRYWEFDIDDHWYKAKAGKVCFLNKQALLQETNGKALVPSPLNEEQVKTLIRWRANRYYRDPLPSSFETKIRPLKNQGLFEKNLSNCSTLFINIDPPGEADQYTVRIFGLQKRGSNENEYNELNANIESMIEAINGISGLNCPFCGDGDIPIFEAITPAMRRGELTIKQKDYFKRWNLDYLSIEEGDFEGMDTQD